MEHTPSVPIDVEMGWAHSQKPSKKCCMSCGAKLPESEQSGSDYYHCSNCSHVSTEYQ